MIAYHTRAGRPPVASTLAERAAFAVATNRASGRDGDVETRGRAIEACLEAAHAPGGERARWLDAATELRKEDPAYAPGKDRR